MQTQPEIQRLKLEYYFNVNLIYVGLACDVLQSLHWSYISIWLWLGWLVTVNRTDTLITFCYPCQDFISMCHPRDVQYRKFMHTNYKRKLAYSYIVTFSISNLMYSNYNTVEFDPLFLIALNAQSSFYSLCGMTIITFFSTTFYKLSHCHVFNLKFCNCFDCINLSEMFTCGE